MSTLTFVATPAQTRNNYWAVYIPAHYTINIRLDDKKSLKPLGYLRPGADVELNDGDAVLVSEMRNHNKPRAGYDVRIYIALDGQLCVYEHSLQVKNNIKKLASPDQWDGLSSGSGDVAGCLRILKWHDMSEPMQWLQTVPFDAPMRLVP